MQSGSLDTRIAILRDTVEDGTGGVVRSGEFAVAFRRQAQAIFNPKTEEIEAGYAIDRQPAEFIVRDDPQTRAITAADRIGIADETHGEYAIVAVVPPTRIWPYVRIKAERGAR